VVRVRSRFKRSSKRCATWQRGNGPHGHPPPEARDNVFYQAKRKTPRKYSERRIIYLPAKSLQEEVKIGASAPLPPGNGQLGEAKWQKFEHNTFERKSGM